MLRLRNYLFDHLQRLTFAFHSKNATGELIQRVTSDVNHIQRFYSEQAIGLGRIGLLFTINFTTGVCDFLPRYQPKEFFRPGQVDPVGNFNNVFMGGTFDKPRLRLPGSAGIADVTVFEENVCLYVPRRGRHTFGPQLDFRSGVGHVPERTRGCGPRYLVSDLGHFDFGGENGRLRLTTHHPNITPQHIHAKTGFPLEIAPNLRETEPPSPEELHLLREKIDPLGIRTLETLSGAHRKAKLREILQQEAAA